MIVLLLLLPFVFVGLVIGARIIRSPRATTCSALATIASAPILGCCVFGYFASYEIAGGMPFRVGYASFAILTLLGLIAAWWPNRHSARLRQMPRTKSQRRFSAFATKRAAR